jgi:hypothetical protein
VVDTNIMGTLYLIQKVGRDMRARGQGRVLITGSIAGFMPGTYQAVYNGTKAFLDSFSFALRHELKDTGVTVTCLMPGATETEFFARADMLDTKVGTDKKDSPAFVAQQGFDAMKKGEGEVIAGWMNKMRAAIAHIAPADLTAEMHRKMAEPGSAGKKDVIWFALNEERPLVAFAGIWTTVKDDRGPKSKPIPSPHLVYGFLTSRPIQLSSPFIPRRCLSFSRPPTNGMSGCTRHGMRPKPCSDRCRMKRLQSSCVGRIRKGYCLTDGLSVHLARDAVGSRSRAIKPWGRQS